MLFDKLSLATVRQPPSLIAKCGACKLYLGCRSPKMPVHGQGKKGIMVIGEAPGALEDERNRPFIGMAGQKVRQVLNAAGVDLDRDCWTTNSIICRPPDNATPTDNQVDYCQPNVIKAINDHKPSTIILLGGTAVRSVIPYLWKDDGLTIGRWAGWQIPSQKVNAWVCPAYHPSYVKRCETQPNGVVVDRYFREHITAACELSGRPWKKPMNIVSKIRVEQSPSKAAAEIVRFIEAWKPIAFDFETNMLKPDHPDSRIVSCAISNGVECIAYPWAGAAIHETKLLLQSAIPKRGWNISFEQRWAKRHGIRVNNWEWDGMVATHVLDNRPGICSFKFQFFVRFGQQDYDSHIEDYLKADHGYQKNRIDQIPLEDLLLYNGIDAHGEFLVDTQQMKEMKV